MKKADRPVVIGVGIVVVLVGVFAFSILRPSPPPPPAGPARFAPTVPPSPPATRAGYLACLSRRELDEVVTFARAKDDASIRTLVERGRCVQLRDGVRVTVLERPSSGVVVFVVQGEPAVRFYTITEAISGR